MCDDAGAIYCFMNARETFKLAGENVHAIQAGFQDKHHWHANTYGL